MASGHSLNFRGKFGGKFNIPRGVRQLMKDTFVSKNLTEHVLYFFSLAVD